VVAHSGKSIGGGLPELRETLAAAGIENPLWFEVPKSKLAPKQIGKALARGADLVFVWGGDGMVQRSVDALAGSDAALAIIPAGTANLFASNVGIPNDVAAAVAIGLEGERHRFDVGRINGERFAVMAGAGFDALMIDEADGALKDRLGRAAYILTGAKNLGLGRFATRVRIDGQKWFKGKASCVLVGNVGKLMGNIAAFPDASADDGSWRSGSSPQRTVGSGRARSCAPPSGTQTDLRSWKPPAAARSTFVSTSRSATSSTAEVARRPSDCGSRSARTR